MGLRGPSFGGGGHNLTIGIGAIDTKGRAGGTDDYGKGVGELGPKKRPAADPTDGGTVVQGSLDRELIRRVIRDSIQKVRYCYEKELRLKPSLAGRVSVRFVIGPQGEVQSARIADGSSLNDAALGECITVRVRSLRFPSPKGGGEVIVTYPFVFTQSGE